MKFENIIRILSRSVAGVLVFLFAAGFYLSVKGFVMGEDGVPVLVKRAQAHDIVSDIGRDVVLPKGHRMGKDSAPITLYEFSSFGCFHCADFHLKTLKLIEKKYIEKGLVRVVFVPFPLEDRSMQGALIAECLPDNKYFAFADLLFEKQREWGLAINSLKTFERYASMVGLPQQKFEACLKDESKIKEIFNQRQMSMENFKIQGTPSFLLVKGEQRKMLYGAPSFEGISRFFDKMLQK